MEVAVAATMVEKGEALASPEQQPRGLRLSKTAAGFFIMGVMIGLPAMVTETSASKIFAGFTGIYEICNSVVAALVSFSTPFLARYISYNLATWICFVASGLAYIICTLPNPLAGAVTASLGGPIVGAMLGGFVYAFGTNMYMAAAAFFPQEAVLALSAGSGLSVVLGPALYIGVLSGFGQDWRRTFLVFLPTILLIPLTWWLLMDPAHRAAAERSRLISLGKSVDKVAPPTLDGRDEENGSMDRPENDDNKNVGDRTSISSDLTSQTEPNHGAKSGRLRLLFMNLIPRYILPLMLLTTSATVSMMGSAPTLQDLARFRDAPGDDLQFQLSFLSYGAAQFLFSTLAGVKPWPVVWGWTIAELGLCVIGIIQLFHPFLTYYGVWVVVMFFVGGCVGAGVTNTNYKISEDFRASGASDEDRSFAMSYAGAGNFGGDAVGAALGLLMERLASRSLRHGN